MNRYQQRQVFKRLILKSHQQMKLSHVLNDRQWKQDRKKWTIMILTTLFIYLSNVHLLISFTQSTRARLCEKIIKLFAFSMVLCQQLRINLMFHDLQICLRIPTNKIYIKQMWIDLNRNHLSLDIQSDR